MKIIQVIPHLGSGGAERLTVDLCNRLVEVGHSVILCVLNPLKSPYDFFLKQVDDRVYIKCFDKSLGFSLKVLVKLTVFIIKQKPDIVHSHLRALPYCSIADTFFTKGVHTVHSEASVEASRGINRIVRRFLFGIRRVRPVAISPESFNSFKDYYGFDPDLVENGRDVPKNLTVSESVLSEFRIYRRTNKTRVIVHLAHIDEVKRQDLHARVIGRLWNEGFDFSVLFIGSLSDSKYVQLVKKYSSPNLFFLGEKQNPLEYLKEAGAFALTSLYEGLPMSLIEAIGVGAIPVCMPLGGIPNLIIDGENGFLSKDLTEESFYATEKRFLETSESTINEMKRKALDSYAPYTMKNCAEKYLLIYESLKSR